MNQEAYPDALPAHHRLHWYVLERVLGQGGFGITYLAHDGNLDLQVAIKEYLPADVAQRRSDACLRPRTQALDERYRAGLARFIEEARTLARFDHPNIVRVQSVFEANQTAYMVMRFEAGENLAALLDRRGTLGQDELLRILLPILGGLEQVHAAGFIHRDIKPENIHIRSDGSPVLLDFGSARQSLGRGQAMTVLVAPGYAPLEQYYGDADTQGPWTDVYGLAATAYRALSGAAPHDAIQRARGRLGSTADTMVPATSAGRDRFDAHLLAAIDHGLQLSETDRPQSIASWRRELLDGVAPAHSPDLPSVPHDAVEVNAPPPPTPTLAPAAPAPAAATKAPPSPRRPAAARRVLAAAALGVVAIGVPMFWTGTPAPPPGEPAAPASAASPALPAPAEIKVAGQTASDAADVVTAAQRQDRLPQRVDTRAARAAPSPRSPANSATTPALNAPARARDASDASTRIAAAPPAPMRAASAETTAAPTTAAAFATSSASLPVPTADPAPAEKQLALSTLAPAATASDGWAQADEAYRRGDYPSAYRLLRPLGDQGVARAQERLGSMAEEGRGTPPNALQAYIWYSLAMQRGQASAQPAIERVARKLQPAEIGQANRLVQNWRPQ